MYIHHLKIYTNTLDKVKGFYGETLGFEVTESGETYFTVNAGHSLLTFLQNNQPHYYHFAFNIPSYQAGKALEWLKKRDIPILPNGHQQLIDFPNWNAKSVYFEDPAGNIVEFIARRDLALETGGPFHIVSVEGISEIGLPVDDVGAAFRALHTRTGIDRYWGDDEHFCAAGDPHGLLIIVNEASKTWFPTDKPSKNEPLHLSFSQGGEKYELDFLGKQILGEQLITQQ